MVAAATGVGGKRRAKGRIYDPWSDLEWEQHAEAKEVVAAHPDGMTLEEVGRWLGITRERVRQIEAGALVKLRDGTGGATATVGGLAIALVDCETCGLPFVRQGRGRGPGRGESHVCEGCFSKPAPPSRPVRRPPSRKLVENESTNPDMGCDGKLDERFRDLFGDPSQIPDLVICIGW
jgi:hypothetical protein